MARKRCRIGGLTEPPDLPAAPTWPVAKPAKRASSKLLMSLRTMLNQKQMSRPIRGVLQLDTSGPDGPANRLRQGYGVSADQPPPKATAVRRSFSEGGRFTQRR